MLSRRFIFLLCLLFTMASYAVLLYFAPVITILSAKTSREEVISRYRVDLHEEIQPPPPELPTPEEAMSDVEGSIQDMMRWDEERISAFEDFNTQPAEIPGLDERVADEPLQREYDLEQAEESLRRVDAKILEIDAATARADIEVARRFVQPSPDRILKEDEFPVLRSPFGDDDDLSMPVGGPSGGLPSAKGKLDEKIEQAVPEFEDVLDPVLLEPDIVEPVEDILTASTLTQEVDSLKNENEYAFMDDLIDLRLETYIPAGEQAGYFRLRILPRADRPQKVLPKDLTFVVDASSSIQQRKLDLTARGISRALDQLNPEDRFNIVIFRDTPVPFQREKVPATPENIDAAKNFLKDIESRGETDVYKAILPVVQELPRTGTPGVVVVVSDGRPTTGLRDSRGIINGLTSDNDLRNSIYAFGGGRTVNQQLLDLLAYRNKGSAEVTQNIDSIDEALPIFCQQLESPLLVELDANYGRLSGAEVFPSVLPDFYEAQPITIYGRFDPEKDEKFFARITGQAESAQKEVIFRTNFEDATTGDPAIAKNWAFQKAYHLIGEMTRVGETPELLGELRQLSQTYGIRTSYDK